MENANREPVFKTGGGVVVVLMAIAAGGVVANWATGPFLAWLSPRQWLGIHLGLAGLWATVWVGWNRRRTAAVPVVIATFVVVIWPVARWLMFGWCLIAETCDF